MQSKIQFDPDKHKYFVGGREIPSVTTILKEITILVDRWFKPGSDTLGTKVHEYLELIDKGYKIHVPQTLRGYVKAYEDVLTKCNTKYAPWHIVPADNKWYRNFIISSTIADTLEQMDPKFPKPEKGIEKIVVPD